MPSILTGNSVILVRADVSSLNEQTDFNILQWNAPCVVFNQGDNPSFPFTLPDAGSSDYNPNRQSLTLTSVTITPNYASILEIASIHAPPDLADWIAAFLEWHYSSISKKVTGLRARLVSLITYGDVKFCIVEWKEDNTDIMAIFHPEARNAAYSCLLHYGGGPWQLSEGCWTQSSLSWYVADISHLRDLFVVPKMMKLTVTPSSSSSSLSSLQRYFQANDAEPSME